MTNIPRKAPLVSAALLALAGCGGSGNSASAQMMAGQSAPGMMGGQMMGSGRHRQVMMNGIPAAYASLRNPLPANAATLASGRQVYAQNCAICHGESGAGDGPAAQGLNPPPVNLRLTARMPMSRSDGYLYWTIAEGGQPFGTAMPAFKQNLSKQQIWAVIAYIQAGLPTATK